MALKLVLENLEEVDEANRGMYVEKEGKFHLDVEGLDAVTQEAAKVATKRANKEAQDERQKRKVWEQLGKSPDEIQTMLEEWGELKQLQEKNSMTEAEKKGQWDQLKQQMNEKHQLELTKRERLIEEQKQVNAQLRQSIEKHLISSTATSAIVQHKGIPQLLLPYVTQHLRVTENEGKFEVAVIDDNGEPIVSGNGEPITPSDFVSEMQTNELFGRAFQGTGSSGGGTRPGAGGNQSGDPSIHKRSDFKTEKDRAAYIDKYSLERYLALPM